MDLTRYSPSVVDKIHRLFDFLEHIDKMKFLSDRLSFYGGSALNFIHFTEVPRLSVDLDFNFRQSDGETEWGDVRKEIDSLLLRILNDLGYESENIKVQASYPLGRMDIKYGSLEGSLGNIKIEIGYMRRIPIMKIDNVYRIENPGSGSKFDTRSPRKEELFANKFCTMISRKKTQMNARDVFDVFSISGSDFDMDLFLDIVMIEGLMMDLDLSNSPISLNAGSLVSIRDLVIGDIDLKQICEKVNSFADDVYEELERKRWTEFKDEFRKNQKIDYDYFKNPDALHSDLDAHPQIRWIIEKEKR